MVCPLRMVLPAGILCDLTLPKSTGNTEPMELNIEGGTFNGNLVVDSSITNASSIINVTGTPSFKGTGWDSYKK